MHLNLWRFDSDPTADQEVVFTDFVFVPQGATGVADDEDPRLPPARGSLGLRAAPNPFNPSTLISF